MDFEVAFQSLGFRQLSPFRLSIAGLLSEKTIFPNIIYPFSAATVSPRQMAVVKQVGTRLAKRISVRRNGPSCAL